MKPKLPKSREEIINKLESIDMTLGIIVMALIWKPIAVFAILLTVIYYLKNRE